MKQVVHPRRPRSRSNSRPRPSGNTQNRSFDSQSVGGRIRGNPQQLIDKYLSWARDAAGSGDRVKSESFLQYADHYARLLLAAKSEKAEREAARVSQEPQVPEPSKEGQSPEVKNEAVEVVSEPSSEASASEGDETTVSTS